MFGLESSGSLVDWFHLYSTSTSLSNRERPFIPVDVRAVRLGYNIYSLALAFHRDGKRIGDCLFVERAPPTSIVIHNYTRTTSNKGIDRITRRIAQ
jgi:hypothetical protein